MKEATYTKLRNGSWGLRVAGDAEVDDIVLARRRNGVVTRKLVTRVVWAGNGVALCEMDDVPKTAAPKENPPVENDNSDYISSGDDGVPF